MSWSDFQQTVNNSWRLMIPRERHLPQWCSMQVSRCRWNLPQQTRWGGFFWWKGGFVLCVWNLLVVFMVNWCKLLVCLNFFLCKFHVLSQFREYVIGQLFNMWLHHNWSVHIYIIYIYMVICWCTRLALVAGWVSRDPHRGGTKITQLHTE